MIDLFKTLFKAGERPASAGACFEPGHLAAAALLVEAAMLDGHFGEDEQEQIEHALKDGFELDDRTVNALIAKAEEAARHSVEWQGFTAQIKDACDHDERVQIVEMLWRVALADDELHDFEASLIRRICGLLYVTGRESSEAKERARRRLNT